MPETMPEAFDDPEILAAFERYRTEIIGQSVQDAGQVRAIAHRRARTRLVMIAAIIALVLAVPAAAYALASGGGRHSPAHPTPSVSVSDSPSPAGSPSAGLSTGTAPDGGISAAELTSITIDLPIWSDPYPDANPSGASPSAQCPTRQVRLHQRTSQYQAFWIVIDKLAHGDVDRDGVPETVALLSCAPQTERRLEQVVAFDRNATGSVVVLGQVVRHGVGQGAIARLYALDLSAPARGVGVRVGDVYACCGVADYNAEHQWRWYSWNGRAFPQSGGPTQFTAVPKSFGRPTIKITTLALGAPSAGRRHGSFTVTATNTGPAATPGLRLEWTPMALPDAWPSSVTITAQPAECAIEQPDGMVKMYVCHHPQIAAGESVTYTFTVSSATANDVALAANGRMRITALVEQPGIRVIDVPATDGTSFEGSITLG